MFIDGEEEAGKFEKEKKKETWLELKTPTTNRLRPHVAYVSKG